MEARAQERNAEEGVPIVVLERMAALTCSYAMVVHKLVLEVFRGDGELLLE